MRLQHAGFGFRGIQYAKMAPALLLYKVLIATGGLTLDHIKGRNVKGEKVLCVKVKLKQEETQSLTSQ